MTCDTLLGLNISINSKSLALTVWDRQGFEDIFTKDDCLDLSINYDCVCRTAPAKMGLVFI